MGITAHVSSFMETILNSQKEPSILIACSGGRDSMALIHSCLTLGLHRTYKLGVVHVNHQLRLQESEDEEAFVRAFCEQEGIAFHSQKLAVQEALEKHGGNVQHVCRELRYAYFNEVMKEHGYSVLLVGHHADDQVETILLGLQKGAPTIGMKAIRRLPYGLLARPFLLVSRAEINTYVNTHEVAYKDDSSNEKRNYRRNDIRQTILADWNKENPSLTKNVALWSEQKRAEDAYLDDMVETMLEAFIHRTEENVVAFPTIEFAKVPSALQKRAVLLLLSYLYPPNARNFPQGLIDQLHRQCVRSEGSAHIDLPWSGQANRSYSMMRFSRLNRMSPMDEPQRQSPTPFVLGSVNTQPPNKTVYFLQLKESELPLQVRKRQPGDRLLLHGMEKTKKVSRIFIDDKVPEAIRNEKSILVTATDEVIGILGVRLGNRFTKHKVDSSSHWIHFID
ncbi:tRNA lysidine(34) synthetase TilS [Paenisporosarcina cavernae]|uniref:tRNA(Ile)-lysidine synthase n=1 Tax=Paenisporosarcina cavernae TaxID=2320858 RepID=A0A385YVW8_9BACL|nr:tRNA lysidine(34) synthetase TilS [Paenisporosarcina cavernae]AYC30684.1 tRNA lysidine(34) synthetase TilS [Paenisporosarcina cavernae]